ncbi:MAG: 50S ribosomal protein L15 [Planctomycetes bacterium]|nr:50S ribosomal protein L15 [Planctomycetota bacterium]
MNLNTVLGPGTRFPDRRRVGRGTGSGLGKTSGKGHKGAKARSGWSSRAAYEGGQMPLYRRLPKKGFTNSEFRERYTVINVRDLNAFDEDARVDLDAILAKGLTSKTAEMLKVLGDGELEKRLHVIADRVTPSARLKIEKAGGAVEEKHKPAYPSVKPKRKRIPSAPKPTHAKATPATKAKKAAGAAGGAAKPAKPTHKKTEGK